MILESIKTVLKELKVNKLRTFLTMLGIIIGIFSITVIFILSNSVKKTMNASFSSFEGEFVQVAVFPENKIQREFVDKDLIEYAENNQNINNISRVIYFSYDKLINMVEEKINNSNGSYWADVQPLGIDENYEKTTLSKYNEDRLLEGRLLNKKDIINKMPYTVISTYTAELLFGRTDVVGQTININNHEFEIIGILLPEDDSLISGYYQAEVYIPYNYVIEYMNGGIDTQIYILNVTNKKYTQEIKENTKKILNEYLTTEQYSIVTNDIDEFVKSMESIINLVEIVFAAIAGLSILVGGIGIMNIMLVSVSERIKETGLRMALGAKNSDIVFQFLVEGIIITIISGIIGIILALLSATVINAFIASQGIKEFSLTLDFLSMIKTILFCGLIGIVFGIYPAIKAGKLDPVEALKYE